MALKIQEIHKIVGGILEGESNEKIAHFIIDSRKHIPSEAVLFFALKGERIDGHKYISELAPKGIRHFVVEKIPDGLNELPLCFIKVENTLDYLASQNQHTILEINLHSLVENYRFYRSLIKPEVKLMAMVKAFSYGSGGYEVASVLEYNKVEYLAVAYANEGVELRKRGIKLPIMVMSPEIHDFNSVIKYNLEPELYSLRILKEFLDFLSKNAVTEWPVHIKIDTGMHRLGFERNDLPSLIELIIGSKCRIITVFSHLAASEDERHDSFTKKQISDFVEICDIIKKETGRNFIRHILYSPGIERFPEASFEMVRLGIGLYGHSSHYQNKLKEVSSFKTRISQIRELDSSETVGYGRKGVLKKTIRNCNRNNKL